LVNSVAKTIVRKKSNKTSVLGVNGENSISNPYKKVCKQYIPKEKSENNLMRKCGSDAILGEIKVINQAPKTRDTLE
jgi:hypothetical protein